jgi:alpha,alpha-trehalase
VTHARSWLIAAALALGAACAGAPPPTGATSVAPAATAAGVVGAPAPGRAGLSAQRISRLRAYIHTTWDGLTRTTRDLPRAAVDPKAEHAAGAPWPVYVARDEDLARVTAAVRAALSPDAMAAIALRALPPDPAAIREHGLLYLPRPYVVPGGRFNEMYGWDSYFIVLGLLHDGLVARARDMVDDFIYEVAHYGGVLNANRTYYLTRSQPPLLGSMVLALFRATGDRAWLASARDALAAVHRHWTTPPHLIELRPHGLSRYYDHGEGPAPEVVAGERDASGQTHYDRVRAAFRSTLEPSEGSRPPAMGSDGKAVYARRALAGTEGSRPPAMGSDGKAVYARRALAGTEGSRPPAMGSDGKAVYARRALAGTAIAAPDVDRYYDRAHDRLTPLFYKGDRSMRESGFDPSDRFGPFGAGVIRFAPVCLNTLLYRLEQELAEIDGQLGRGADAAAWTARAAQRRALIDRFLWDERAGLYFDYDFEAGARRAYPFATTFWPLAAAGLASPAQARRVRDNLALFERPGGVMTSTNVSGSQWDAPFGWAPLQLFAVEGLRRHGFGADADRIAGAFLSMLVEDFERRGTLVEKYDVVRRTSDTRGALTFGYTSNEIGFGWTNGVALELLQPTAP